MKTVIFIGNRNNTLSVLILRAYEYKLKKIFVLEDSPLHKEIISMDVPYAVFKNTKEHKFNIINYLNLESFDLLVSNGCPFILPISELKKIRPYSLFINTHPSYLPHLKGKTPLNGVFYLNYDFIGATTHYMDDGIDTGNIIYQKKVDLTPDIDQGLVYFLSFRLETDVFEKALNLLEKNQYVFKGQNQLEEGSYFNRESAFFTIDFFKDKDNEILKKVKSVGMPSQGIELTLGNFPFRVFEGEKIVNQFLVKLFLYYQPGTLLLKYSNKLLIKSLEGIIKFSYV